MRQLVVVVVVMCVATSVSSGATWRVERDGSGDFTTIQPAVDGASPGDTIRIGAGRYTEHHPFSPSGVWSRETYVAITVDNLTIVGAERDAVIIGPETQDFVDFGPKGIVTSYFITRVSIRCLTMTNVYDGIFSFIDTRIEGCAFSKCGYGVMGQCAGAAYVADCAFSDNKYGGVFAYSPTMRLDVVTSQFSGIPYGISAGYTPEVAIRDCEFVGGTVGVQFEGGTHGAISGCRVRGAMSTGYSFITGSVGTVTESIVDGGQVSISCASQAVVTGVQDILRGASYAAILIGNGSVTLAGCHVLWGGRRLVQLDLFSEPPDVKMDLRNNYWGIATRDSIADLIWDGSDDPAIHAFVDFEPFSPTPLPTEKKSLGGVKGLYR